MKNYIFIAVAAIAVLLWGGLSVSHAAVVGETSNVQAVAAQSVETSSVSELSTEQATPAVSTDSVRTVQTRGGSSSTSGSRVRRLSRTETPPIQKVECKGDMNGDGFTNFKDINSFRTVAVNSDFFKNYESINWKADINGDGSANLEDINPFVAFLSNSTARICRPVVEDTTPSVKVAARQAVSDVSCMGDVNGDGLVNFGDINPLSNLVQGGELIGQFMPEYSEAFAMKYAVANINGDGAVNNADINPFVALLSNPASQVCRAIQGVRVPTATAL